MNNFEARRADMLERIMNEKYVFDLTTPELDRLTGALDVDMLHVILDDGKDGAIEMIRAATMWYEIPHAPGCFPIDGNPDFLSLRLSWVLAEPRCYNKLPPDVKEGLRVYFTTKDYRSVHGSENHFLMFRASRYLAAQEYPGEYFENYGKRGDELWEYDRRYIEDFLDYRARQGWGEFDSDYTSHIMLILTGLYQYSKHESIRRKCQMMMDIILLDMLADSHGYLWGGAHGRIYPYAILDRERIEMAGLCRYYFGEGYYEDKESLRAMFCVSDYVPSPIVYAVAKEKESSLLPYENRERKHLHSTLDWGPEDINWKSIGEIGGSINKYTYVCKDYALGGINLQEAYPMDHPARWYAYHQQQDWELTLPHSKHKIFTHHCEYPGVYGCNSRWAGDGGCGCGRYYINRNTAIAMYNIDAWNASINIDRSNAPLLINAFVPLDAFKEKIFEEKYLFLAYDGIYISLYFDNGFRVNDFDEFRDRELLSEGRQNAVILRVAPAKDYPSLKDFGDAIKSIPVIFDRAARTVSFDGIFLSENGNSEGGVPNVYPYAYTYDCPFMKSDWNSGIITVTAGGKTAVYDFNKNEIEVIS